MSALPPLRHEVTVAAEPERAFECFTDDISAWWPLASLSVLGQGSLVGFGDDVLAEATVDGREAIWGEVLDWEPGRLLRVSWHPGADAAAHTVVSVNFAPTDDGTLVTLEQAGWEALEDPAGSRSEYDQNWPSVLDLYREHCTPDVEPGDTWVVLAHSPGPDAPGEGSLFADPRFPEHVAFLERMQERGYLLAAGPLPDADGSGMTILRLPGAGRLAEATELATQDDAAVTSGLLSVQVRPWNVIFDATG